MTDHRKQYLIEAYHDIKEAKKGIDGMTEAQFEAIRHAIVAIQEAMDYAEECHDLRLSDVAKLHNARWALVQSINTEPTDYMLEEWAEYGIGQDDKHTRATNPKGIEDRK